MRRFGRLQLAVGAALLLGACVSHPGYPGRWAPISPEPAACAAVAGRYVNDGDSEPPLEGRASRLVDALELEGERRATRVEIQQRGADEIEIVAWTGTQPTGRTVLRAAAGDFECTPEGVMFKPKSQAAHGAGITPAYIRSTVYLSRATDGSLIVRSDIVTVATIIVVPAAATERIWRRFKPVD